MTNLKNVLLPTDFSQCAEAAFPYALALAERANGVLYIAHITTPDMYGYAPEVSAKSLFEQLRIGAREQMARFTSSQDFRGVPFELLFGEGDVWEELESMMADHKVDLIVLSTHGRRGLKKLIMGSVAEEIIRLATVPVLTVGPHCQPSSEKPFRKILFPTDLSEHSILARNTALCLASDFKGDMVALHVAPAAESSVERERNNKRLSIQLQQFMASENPDIPNVPAELHIHHGETGEEILRAASEYGTDLIVMSVREAGPSPRMATGFGSIAHTVISRAVCPVLSLRH